MVIHVHLRLFVLAQRHHLFQPVDHLLQLLVLLLHLEDVVLLDVVDYPRQLESVRQHCLHQGILFVNHLGVSFDEPGATVHEVFADENKLLQQVDLLHRCILLVLLLRLLLLNCLPDLLDHFRFLPKRVVRMPRCIPSEWAGETVIVLERLALGVIIIETG